MENELMIFNNPEFGEIRTIEEDGKVLFCGSDVAKALGYSKPQNAIDRHCKCALKRGIPHPQSPDKTIEMLFIPEGDIYRLAAKSELPGADKFESWIFDDVLPSIRKHGAYMTPDTLATVNPDLTSLSPELQMFKAIFDSVAKTELKQKEQDKAIEAVNQKVDGIRDVVVLNPNSWREECRKLLAKVAQARGGGGAYQEVNAEVFQLVDERARVSLETRLTNKRRRMADEGVCKSKRDKLNKVDVIADDAKLIEIYIAIVKEMAVKCGVSVGKGTEQAR